TLRGGMLRAGASPRTGFGPTAPAPRGSAPAPAPAAPAPRGGRRRSRAPTSIEAPAAPDHVRGRVVTVLGAGLLPSASHGAPPVQAAPVPALRRRDESRNGSPPAQRHPDLD